ncbi:MAG: MBL fold metallo-hydrolase [Patescibacteria group bacterium]
MEITYLGHSAFKLRGKHATVVTDPYDPAMTGPKFPKHVTCDIVTISHDHEDHNANQTLEGSPFLVKGPGEYEIKGVEIVGINSYHDSEKGAQRGRNTIYRIEIDEVSVVHLGDLGHILTTSDVDSLDGVDVLLIPVGGIYTIDAATAASVVKTVEPRVVIPMHYGRPDLNPQVFRGLTPVTEFLRQMGKEGIAAQPKLTLTKDKLPEELQVVVLQ